MTDVRTDNRIAADMKVKDKINLNHLTNEQLGFNLSFVCQEFLGIKQWMINFCKTPNMTNKTYPLKV